MKTSIVIQQIVVFLLLSINFTDVYAQCSISSNLVTNGNFSSGNTGFSSSYGYNPGNLTPEGKYDVLTNPHDDHTNFSACGDHTSGSGKMMVVNGAATAGVTVWCGSVTVSPNSSYTFSTWVASVHATSPAILQFSINGVNLGSTFTASSTTCNWQQFCETWNSGASTTASICIVNQNTASSGNDFALDDIQMGITSSLYIKLLSFTAKNYSQGAHLKWSTSEEMDHDYFGIEKSSDLQHWEEIGQVLGKGNSNQVTNYEFFDHSNATNLIVYYRIKSVDKRGYVEYSYSKSVNEVENKITVCPNPSFDKISILSNQKIKEISICNSMEIEQKRISSIDDEMLLSDIDISQLTNGIYYLKIISMNNDNESQLSVVRFIKR